MHVALLDSSGVIVSVNEAWRQFDTANLLRGPAFAMGRNYLEVCERATGALSGQARAAALGIRRVLQGQAGDFSMEYAWPTPMKEFWFRLMATRVGAEHTSGVVLIHADISLRRDTDDALRQGEDRFRNMAAASAEDITQRKQAEESLVQFRTLIDKSDVAIEVLDAKTPRFIDVSESGYTSLGYSREEFLALSPAEIVPDITPHMRKRIEKILDASGSITFESRHRRKDGTTFPVEIHANRVRLDGSFDVVVVRDITERKKLEQQLYRSQRMESIGALAGGIAHDLNNILAPIMMSIRVLKDISHDPHAKDILKTIEASAKRGGNIVRQILSFARGLEGERSEIPPKEIVKELSNIVKDTFPKDIQLRFSVPNNTWMILGDPTQVHQILFNLCLNARDAMPKGGELTICFENCVLDKHAAAMEPQARSGRFVRISVTDTGTGMKRDVLKKIFEPFYTTKAVGQGTGLGLSTVVAIVKRHYGRVNVYSEMGKGTTFKVYLPAMKPAGRARKRPAEKTGLPRGNRQTILVVDDEPPIRKITQKTLAAFGYEVLTAPDGARAMAVYSKHKEKIDVVLTDMGMPMMDGAAVIRALTAITPDLKIIAASGLRSKNRMTKSLRGKVKYFLTKPYTAETLLRILRATLEEK